MDEGEQPDPSRRAESDGPPPATSRWSRGRIAVVATVLVVLAVLAGTALGLALRGGDDEDLVAVVRSDEGPATTVSTTTTVPPSAPTPTTAATTTTTTSTTTTTTAPQPTTEPPPPPLPAGCQDGEDECRGSAVGDVDGDGLDDLVEYLGSETAFPAVRVTLGSGRTLERPGEEVGATTFGVALQGLTDVDGDGDLEIVAISGCGAHACQVEILFAVDDALVEATIGGEASGLLVDSANFYASGFACTEVDGQAGLVVTSAEGDTDVARLTTTPGTWEGTDLRLGEDQVEELPAGPDGGLPEEVYGRVPTIDCPGLTPTYG